MVKEVAEQQEDNNSDWLIELLEELANNPQDYSIPKTAEEIRRRCSNEVTTLEQRMASTDIYQFKEDYNGTGTD